MIGENDKTPAIIPTGLDGGRTPTPRLQPAVLKKPPLGRPPGALSISEMVDQITRDVRRATLAEIERRHTALRTELAADVRSATHLSVAAIAMNALAIVVSLALARVPPVRGLGLALAALAAGFVGAVRLGWRRGSTAR
jgi:hypothetical protein